MEKFDSPILDTIGIQTPDSTTNVLDSFENFITSSNSMVYSFWLSVGAILLIYLLKKLYIKELYTGEEIIPTIQEFFIDLCVTMIPLIAMGSIEANKAYFGIFLVFVSIILVSFCAYLRKWSCICYKDAKYFWLIFCFFFCIVLCLINIISVYYYISRRWIL